MLLAVVLAAQSAEATPRALAVHPTTARLSVVPPTHPAANLTTSQRLVELTVPVHGIVAAVLAHVLYALPYVCQKARV